jgi:ribose transport system permease protein
MNAALVSAPAEAERRTVRRGAPAWLSWAGYATVLALILALSISSPNFLAPGNLAAVLNQAAVPAIAGFGLAVVIITGGDDVLDGGIDLSAGAVAGLSGTVAAVASQAGVPPLAAIPAALAVAVAVGAVNGGAVVLGLRPLLTTLATMGIAGSLTLVASNNVEVPFTGDAYEWLRDGSAAGLPIAVAVMLVIFAVVGLGLGSTTWGVRSYAVGQNPTAAKVAGISPRKYIFTSYLISAGLAGIAGVLLSVRLSAASQGWAPRSCWTSSWWPSCRWCSPAAWWSPSRARWWPRSSSPR